MEGSSRVPSGYHFAGLPPLLSPYTSPSLKPFSGSELEQAVTENFEPENHGSINHVM